MYCVRCGKEIDYTVKFCYECGKEVILGDDEFTMPEYSIRDRKSIVDLFRDTLKKQKKY